MPHSEFQEKMDVLDIIISILKDHEESLSRLADRFDTVGDDMATFEEKIALLDRSLQRLDGLSVENVVGAVGFRGPLVTVRCRDWLAFQGASHGALLVAFEVTGDRLTFSSVSDLFVFTYSEGLPEAVALMGGGVRRWLKKRPEDEAPETVSPEIVSSGNEEAAYGTVLVPKMVRRWLSSELGIPEEKVIEGRVLR